MHSSYVESKGCHFSFHGVIRKKLIVVSAVVGFLYMSTSSLVCLHVIVRSRKAMELCSSYVRLSFMLLCILFICIYTYIYIYIYMLMVCNLIFFVLFVTNMSSIHRRNSKHNEKLNYYKTTFK